MLRITTKEKLNHILNLQLDVHRKSIAEPEQVLFEIMADCQQAALSVGQCLEKEVPERKDLVEKLEQYCELAFQFYEAVCHPESDSQTSGLQEQSSEKLIAQLDARIIEVRDQLARIPAGYQAVFMPYKAEMWDSLESVWMAFDKDENCEALVMPLPYSQFDANVQKWNPCYEGDRFSEYVPITDYRDYHLEEERPEFIFIHNPYDEYNLVTRINPEYFSYELKKYTKTLVYIPYYLTSGFVQEEHKLLSAYRYMDYMIAQSELFKDGMKESPFYEKILALGSPKLDRVIRLCQGEKQIPEEWKAVIGGKKSVMLNTSLGYLLLMGERYLRKVRACIEWLRENPIVALIWRPHPLFESTIRSLRPELLPMYQELVQHFLDSGIGVLDQTPDIAQTIAIVDAYIGDSMTSVVNLFGAAGRPMFILDATRTRNATEEEKRRFSLAGMSWNMDRFTKVDGKLWLSSRFYNGLFCVGEDWDQVELIHRFENQANWYSLYGGLYAEGREFYLQPIGAIRPLRYRIDTGEEISQGWEEDGKNLGWSGPIPYKDSLFYLSRDPEKLGFYEYKKTDGSWSFYSDCLKDFTSCRQVGAKEPYVSNCWIDEEHYLWCTAAYTNRVMRFDLETHEHKFYVIGSKNYGYAGNVRNGDILYLGEVHGWGMLLEANLKEGTLHEFPIPRTGRVWCNLNQIERAVGGIIDAGDYLVLSPAYSNRMWRFEKATGEFVSLAEAFWNEAAEEGDNFFVECHGICNFCGMFDDGITLMAQRTKDNAILILNVVTGEYEVKYMHLSKEAYAKITEGEDGFQKGGIVAPFVQYESPFFCYEDFIRRVADGELEEVKKRQKEELVTLAANMDGTCGEKVWEYLMENCR